MFCRKCGNELRENATYCSKCGTELDHENIDRSGERYPLYEYPKIEPKGPWKAFAIAGHVVGIICISTIWVPIYCFIFSIEGIVLSALGKKSIVNRRKAKHGLTLSIIACVLNIIWTYLFTFLIAFLLVNYIA